MRRLASTSHADGLPITPVVAVHLVRIGVCTGADIAWLQGAGARWHPSEGAYSLPPFDRAAAAPPAAVNRRPNPPSV